MKKLTSAFVAIILCLTMVCGVPAMAASQQAVEAVPVTTEPIPTTQSTADVISQVIGGAIEGNEDVENATNDISDFHSTLQKILDAFDKFLRAFGAFVNTFLDKVLGNGSLPF